MDTTSRERRNVASGFTHLHLHTSYSLLDGAVRIRELIPAAKELGMDSLAITDHGNMYGAVDFYQQARKAGVKPIIGCEAYVAPGFRGDRTKRGAYHLILLARNNEGYKNLIYLASMANIEGFYYRPRIDRELLSQHSEGLIGMSACLGGEIPRAFREGGLERARRTTAEYKELFEKDSFYLEIQNNGYPEQPALNEALRTIGTDLGIPLVATNDVHYLRASDAQAHEILMCIQTGHTLNDPKRNKMHSDELYLRSADEMTAAMPDFLDAIEQTKEIAEACNVELDLSSTYLPDYDVPEEHTRESYLRQISDEGLTERVEEARSLGFEIDESVYRQRLEEELEIILNMGYAGYYLIVWDFIKESKRRGIPVGPGRGSGAGSAVAWAIRITELDPVRYGLLFERFLNPERVSMPDFDVDFCKNRRDEVIRYVVEKYGQEHVGQIATFHQLKTRSVTRDVGRAMGLPYGDVDKIAKLLPEPGPGSAKITMPQAIKQEPRLKEEYNSNPTVRQLLDFAERLEGLHRHVGMHAGGVVIGRNPLWEHVPVFGQPGKMVTQYDKDFAEACGLVKFDFLGLKTMTILETAVELVNAHTNRDEPLDLLSLPLDDKKTYDLIASGDATTVFQMESKGFRDLIRRLAPDRFEEIVALLALYRPGPLEGGMVDDFVERKHGRAPITYFHELLRPVLEETYGIIVYQEQVMQAARVLAGFTLGAADIMRRAMGKKKAEVMAEQRRKFVSGCAENGIDGRKANEVFDLIDKFAGYGFNKSHSAAYALVSFQTAYLKAHYPVEFMAANLTCDSDDTDRVAFLIVEGRSKGMVFLAPDINESEVAFAVKYDDESDEASIRFGLGALKGVGQSGLEAVMESRKEGLYRDLFDFCSRVDLRRVNRGMLEALIKGGAFDSLGEPLGIDRARTIAAVEASIERGKAAHRDRESGQGSLFDLLADDDDTGVHQADAVEYPAAEPWDSQRLLAAEREALGFYFSGHPLDMFVEEVKTLADTQVDGLASKVGKKVRLCGVVEAYREKPLKSGNGRLAFFQLEDLTGRVEVFVPSRVFEGVSELLQLTDPVVCEGVVQLEGKSGDEAPRLRLQGATGLMDWRQQRYTEVRLKFGADEVTHEQLSALRDVFSRYPGRCLAYLYFERPGAWQTVLALPDRFRVDPSDKMLVEIEGIIGRRNLEFRC